MNPMNKITSGINIITQASTLKRFLTAGCRSLSSHTSRTDPS